MIVHLIDAGADQTVNESSLVTLSGVNSFDSDGDPITYQWVQTGGTPVVLVGPITSTPTFTAPTLAGGVSGSDTLTFALTVSDGALSAADEVTVVVEQVNHVPTANAGTTLTVMSGKLVTLDGSASSDPDGDAFGFQWTQVSGPAVALANATTTAPRFTSPPVASPTELTFRLTVSDTLLTSDPSDVVVTVVNHSPVCSAARAVPNLLWPPNHGMVPSVSRA